MAPVTAAAMLETSWTVLSSMPCLGRSLLGRSLIIPLQVVGWRGPARRAHHDRPDHLLSTWRGGSRHGKPADASANSLLVPEQGSNNVGPVTNGSVISGSVTNGGEFDVQVLGSGVVGLTTAITLAEAGLHVGVRTASPPAATTSAAAGAVWGPVTCGPADRTYEWARTGLAVFRDLETDPAAGVTTRRGREISRVPAQPPGWLNLVPDLEFLPEEELPPGFATGWRYSAPVITMATYLEYLRTRLERAGVEIDVNPITSLTEVTQHAHGAPVIVNCTGVAARTLVPDPAVHPIRGQVVVIANPGIEEFTIDHSAIDDNATGHTGVTYLFPHRDTVLLGGTMDDGDG